MFGFWQFRERLTEFGGVTCQVTSAEQENGDSFWGWTRVLFSRDIIPAPKIKYNEWLSQGLKYKVTSNSSVGMT